MRHFRASLFVVVLALAALLAGCGGKASDKIIGKWGIDVDKMMESDKFKAMPEDKRKEAMEMTKGMAGAITIEITKDKVIADMMGKKDEAAYKILADTADSVDIETTKDGKAEKMTIKIIGDTISMDMKGEQIVMKKKT